MTGYQSNDAVYDLREASYDFGWQDAKIGKEEQPERETKVLALERQVREMLTARDAEIAQLRAQLESSRLLRNDFAALARQSSDERHRYRDALRAIRDQAGHARVEWQHLPGIIEQIGRKAGDALAAAPEADE